MNVNLVTQILIQNKYTIFYTLICLFLFWIIIKYGSSVCNSLKIVESFKSSNLTDFENYSKKIMPYPENDVTSPLYSHTVNLPINDPVSCKNFCGPKSQCLLTREQCTSDIDCQGCKPGSNHLIKDVSPYDAAGKLGQNQGLQYSPLTTGYNNHNSDFAQIYEGSKDVQLKRPYEGVNLWADSFNNGLELYNKKREIENEYSEGISNDFPIVEKGKTGHLVYDTKYPMKISATGLFYETSPPASNASLQK